MGPYYIPTWVSRQYGLPQPRFSLKQPLPGGLGDSDTLVNLQNVVEPRKTYSVFVIDTGAILERPGDRDP